MSASAHPTNRVSSHGLKSYAKLRSCTCGRTRGGEGEKRRELYETATAKNLIPRPGKADEVAQAIVFMVQNDFVTGTTIDVDGGWLLA